MEQRRALALVGFMGSGKSTIGRLVARRSGAPYRDLDHEIEKRCGMSIAQLFRSRGEVAFRALESELLPAVLAPGAIVALGGGAPIDPANWSVISAAAVTVWLRVPLDEVLVRAQVEDGTRPVLQGRTPDEVRMLFEARSRRYAQADHAVDATAEPARVAEEVMRLWQS